MSCRIILLNRGTYSPGDTVHGKVACVFSSRQNFRSINCRFRGRERTSWTEQESYYDEETKKSETRTVQYTGDRKFLSADVTLVGEGSLPSGQHEFPFSFTFPRTGIPNPYSGNYGSIRYYIKAVVDKSFAFDLEDEITLVVVAPIDFNYIRSELQLNPVAYQDEKTICCCCCASGPITMDVILDKEAFVVGEVAKIKVEITNMSNESISDLSCVMKMTIESKTTSPQTSYKYDNELVKHTSATGVGAHGQRTYNIDFQIPPSTVVPNFAGCNLFKQWCVLQVEATIPGCHSNMTIETDAKLGHVPIIGYDSQVTTSRIPSSQTPSAPGFRTEENPPPYPPEGEKAPPYPTGPPTFPMPNGSGNIGFIGSYDQGASSSASAPREEEAPSAPSKSELAAGKSYEAEDDDFEEPPPPSYNESLRSELLPKVHTPSNLPK